MQLVGALWQYVNQADLFNFIDAPDEIVVYWSGGEFLVNLCQQILRLNIRRALITEFMPVLLFSFL